MPASELNITIEQGATFRRTLNLTDSEGEALDLTGYTARSKVRKTPGHPEVIATFTIAFTDRPEGEIEWTLPATESDKIDTTASKNFTALHYFYDFEIEAPNGDITRIFQGLASIIPNVTR